MTKHEITQQYSYEKAKVIMAEVKKAYGSQSSIPETIRVQRERIFLETKYPESNPGRYRLGDRNYDLPGKVAKIEQEEVGRQMLYDLFIYIPQSMVLLFALAPDLARILQGMDFTKYTIRVVAEIMILFVSAFICNYVRDEVVKPRVRNNLMSEEWVQDSIRAMEAAVNPTLNKQSIASDRTPVEGSVEAIASIDG